MEGGRVYVGGGSELMNLLESSNNSVWVPSSSPSFHETMVNFDHERQVTRASVKRSYGGGGDEDDTGGEEFETKPEKKRRLTPDQVEFLEKSFERENKLEPDRKMHLAKTLGLQPRQVAIWFQNRRARYKAKQLEKEYGSLKASYDQLKLDFDALSQEKDHLHNEVKTLTKKLKQRDEQEDMTLANMLLSEQKIPKMTFGMLDKPKLLALPYSNKQLTGDATSAKSDVSDSESPHCTDGNHSSLIEDPTDQQSEFSQDEEELLFMNDRLILPSAPLSAYSTLLKVEDTECYDPNASTGNFSLVDDQPPFWSMLY